MALAELERLISRLTQLTPLDHPAAISLLRDIVVFARMSFGTESPHLSELSMVLFRDRDVIYNTRHYKNREDWDAGVNNLQAILASMKYELQLKAAAPPKLEFPSDVTIHWLVKNISLKAWALVAAVLIGVFFLGFSAASTAFFPGLIALIKSLSVSP